MLDKALVFEPMRRWRERLCRAADLIVTSSAAILPPSTAPQKIVETEWGADTDRFHPAASGPLRFERPAGMLVVFAGAFRSWHGAVHLVRAMRQVRERGRRDMSAVLIGDGPELPRARAEAQGLDGIVFPGPIPHADMPAHLAAADVGAAPFDADAHEPLSLGFYWSPLKIFEYMATGLPVVAPSIDRIPTLVGNGIQGVLYSPADRGGLAAALESLTDASLRARLGRAARARAVADFSWSAHCRTLESAMGRALAQKAPRR
jgi:glycosyltransferase involved in cell wall biosynthesis